MGGCFVDEYNDVDVGLCWYSIGSEVWSDCIDDCSETEYEFDEYERDNGIWCIGNASEPLGNMAMAIMYATKKERDDVHMLMFGCLWKNRLLACWGGRRSSSTEDAFANDMSKCDDDYGS